MTPLLFSCTSKSNHSPHLFVDKAVQDGNEQPLQKNVEMERVGKYVFAFGLFYKYVKCNIFLNTFNIRRHFQGTFTSHLDWQNHRISLFKCNLIYWSDVFTWRHKKRATKHVYYFVLRTWKELNRRSQKSRISRRMEPFGTDSSMTKVKRMAWIPSRGIRVRVDFANLDQHTNIDIGGWTNPDGLQAEQ